MRYNFSPAKNPRVLIIQKVYGQVINNEQKIKFEKHRFKKFIKDVVLGTIERSEIINDEIKNIETNFNLKNLDDIFKIIIRCATFEFLYKPSLSKKIISQHLYLPFININWGTENVLKNTMNNFASTELQYKFLDKKIDIDTIIDIENRN